MRVKVETQTILVIAVAIVMGWFAFGVIYNIRHGEAILKWMKGGLSLVGERTTFRWLGSSVAELSIAQAKSPMRSLQIMMALVPRDVPWIWLPAHLRGRRDTLIFRAQLISAPKIDFDLADPILWTGRMAMEDAAEKNWEKQTYQQMTLVAPAVYQKLAIATLERLEAPMKELSTTYRRFSLRRDSPHLEIHLPPPDYKHIPADQYFKALQDLARLIVQER
jgi:hypothetical protein